MSVSASPQPAAIARALDAPDAEERRQATALVPQLSLDHALPLLLRSLGDDDWRVRKEGANAARGFASETRLIDALLDRLAPGDNVGLRNAAVEVLASSGSAATARVAIRLPTLDADGRKLAVEILGRSRDPAALEPLERALDDEDDNVRQAAVEAIASLGPNAREAVRLLLTRCLDDPDSFVRLTALEGLNAMGAAMSWERLDALAGDSTLRPAALAAAALSENPLAVPMLARALASSRGGGFVQALAALTMMAEGPLAGHVTEALRAGGPELGARLVEAALPSEPVSESPRAASRPSLLEGPLGATTLPEAERRAMALELAAIAGAPGAAEAAIALLSEQALAPSASRALTTLGRAALQPILSCLSPREGARRPATDLGPRDPDVRAELIELAASIAQGHGGEGEVLPVLRAAALDPSPRVATSALVTLSRLGSEDDLPLAAELARSPDPSVAHSAESVLGALAARHPDAARTFADAAVRRDPLSLGATIAIGALAGRTGGAVLTTPGGDLSFLAQAAASGDTRTRRAAVAAVAELGMASAQGGASPLDVLGFALADEERSVQLAAAKALGRICARTSREPDALGDPSTPPPSGRGTPHPGRGAAPRASDVLELVARSQDEDLLAATVRALGDAAALSLRVPSLSPRGLGAPPESDELIVALAPLAQGAPSAVAIAAVDALGRAPDDAPGRVDALLGALDHADPDVVRAAMLKLETAPRIHDRLIACLDHPAAEVRLLAAEMLSELPFPSARVHLARRAAIEQDRSVRRALEAAQERAGEVAGGHIGTPSRMPPRGS